MIEFIKGNWEILLPIATGATGWFSSQVISYLKSEKDKKDIYKNQLKQKEIEHDYALKQKEIESKNKYDFYKKKYIFEIKYPLYQEIYYQYKRAFGAFNILLYYPLKYTQENYYELSEELKKDEDNIDIELLSDSEKQIEFYGYFIKKYALLVDQYRHTVSKNNVIFNKNENTVLFNTVELLNGILRYIYDELFKIKHDNIEEYKRIFIENEKMNEYSQQLEKYMYGIAEIFKISLSLYWEDDDKPLSIEELFDELGITFKKDTI